ncbi:filamentous hemagglutinin N-terminal domain-containing protein, partial [Phormidium sp. FACHB-592]
MNQSHLTAWVLTISSLSSVCAQSIVAQVVPDGTLPTGERSQVSGTVTVQIDGGASRGGNLFHSFSQFSIPTGGTAFFNNAADVQNIFSRVTGGAISNLDGLIRANGTANLFLLNPNGILFGPNASLNIGGSFVATTANAIGFPNGEVFSSDATQPLPRQLLMVNPNAFFFNQLTPKLIVNQSTANNGIGLQVPAGQSLLLIGGDVRLEGGQIISPGSRVELGAVVGQGSVGLSEAAGEWQLSLPASVGRADVAINNGAMIDVRAGGGGSIAIAAKNLTMSGASRLRAGINTGLGFAGAQSGDIQLNATEAINLTDGSFIFNVVRPGGIGNAGNVNITTGALALTGKSALVVNTSGQGNAGSVNIKARNTVSLANSDVFNTVEQTGIGNTGGINITTGSLALTGSSQWVVITYGQGNTGSVNIKARDTVSLDGFLDDFYTTIFNAVGPTGIGNAGSINITTGSLALTRGARLRAYVEGQGNVGSININARDTVSLDGAWDGSSDSGGTTISNKVGRTGIGNTGGINITTGSLALTRRAQVRSFVQGQGNAGSININARDTVSLDGAWDGYSSAIFNTVEQTGIGNTGGINITTGSLALTGGAELLASTSGQGKAGDIIIDARDRVLIDGEAADGKYASSIFSPVQPSGVGQGGSVAITTGSLFLTNGGAVNTVTEGQGNAGRVTIRARDSVQIRGTAPTNPSEQSGVFTTATKGSVGDGGDVTITTGSLSVSDQGRIITDVRSQGKAGAIQIQASDTVLFDGGDALSTLSPGAVGNGGDIGITAQSLSVLNNAQLSSATSGEGNAGNITA